MKKAHLLILLCLAVRAFAQDEPIRDQFPKYVGYPEPNVKLPPQVKAEQGQLTLFADYEHPGDGWLPLYLVNRTDSRQLVDTESGDAYIKLEIQTPTGKWERAQAHEYSFCGNSYGEGSLPPGMHYRIRGYRPVEGIAAKVRYSSYSGLALTSNTGEGFYTAGDLAAARSDRMGLRDVPSCVCEILVPNEALIPQNFPLSTKLAAVRMAEQLGEIPLLRKAAEKWSAELGSISSPGDEQRLALSELRQILSRGWGEPAGSDKLLTVCFAAMTSARRDGAGFGTLEKESDLTWHAIWDIGELQKAKPENTAGPHQQSTVSPIWKDILSHAAGHVLTATEEEANWMSGVIGNQRLADEYLADEAFAPLLQGVSYSTVSGAAEALLRRDRWDMLAEQVVKASPANHEIIFGVVARGLVRVRDLMTAGSDSDGYREVDDDSPEGLFWKKVEKDLPVRTAWALCSIMGNVDKRRNNHNRENFAELFEYWRKEVERSDGQTADFEVTDLGRSQCGSVRFIGAWKNEEDIPLLRSLLRYRGYYGDEDQEDASSDGKPAARIFRFGVREYAAEALKMLGQPVPEDLIFEIRMERNGK